MGGILRQSTAAVIPFGPFLDKTTGVDLEVGAGIITSIDHATTGIFLSKNGGAGAIRHQAVTASVLDAYGMFLVTLDTTDTNTVGRLRVMMAEAATFLPVWDDYQVVEEAVYDAFYKASAAVDVNVLTITANAIDAAAIKDAAIDAATFAAGAITATAIAADAITEAKIADNAFANEHFAAGALTSAKITSAAGCVVASIANNAITANAIQDNAIDLATFAADCKTGSALKANVETITNDAITAASIAADAITDDAIATGAIASTAFAAGAINAAAIASDAIEAAKIKDGAITAAKIADAAIDNATFAADVYVVANVKKINNVTLTGDGGAIPWGPV